MAEMRFVVGDVPEAELQKLAVAYLRRMAWRAEARWHPELLNQQQIAGTEHLRAALDAGRGCIISFVHHGDWEGTFPSLAGAGFPTEVIAVSEMLRPDPPLWMQQQMTVMSSRGGVTLFDVAQGSNGIREALSRGCALPVTLDPPGHTPIRFLGHDLLASTGGSRIAMDLDVPVVMMTSHRNRHEPMRCGRLELAPPLYPHDFESAEELLEVMVRHQEAAVLQWPEAADEPQARMTNRVLAEKLAERRRPA